MATGPEHYREAERLMRGSYVPIGERRRLCDPEDRAPSAYDGNPTPEDVAKAQVHATLAAAAATIELAVSMQDSNGVRADWLEAVST